MPNVYVEDAFGNIRGVDPSEMADFNRNKARDLAMIAGTLDTSGLSGSQRVDIEREMARKQDRADMGEDAFAVLRRQQEKEPTNPGGSAFTQAQQDRMAAGAAAGIAATGSPFGTVLSDIKSDYNYLTSGNALSDLKSNLSTGIADLKTDFGYGDETQGYTDRLPGRLAAAEAANLNMLSNNRDSRPSDIITGVSEDGDLSGNKNEVVLPDTEVVLPGTEVIPGTEVVLPDTEVVLPGTEVVPGTDYSGQITDLTDQLGLLQGNYNDLLGQFNTMSEQYGLLSGLPGQLSTLQGQYQNLLGQMNNYQGGGSQAAAASPVYQNILPTSSTSYTPASLLPLQGVGTSNIKLPASYEKSKPSTFEKYLDYYDEIYPSEEIV